MKLDAELTEIRSEPDYSGDRARHPQGLLDVREDRPVVWYASFRLEGEEYGRLMIKLPSKEAAQDLTVGTKYTVTISPTPAPDLL